MKKLRYWLLIFVLAAVGSLVICVPPVLAANASLYLSPSSRSLTQGSSIYVAVRVSPNGNAVNAVQANLSYPTDKFDYLGASCSSSFSVTAQASGGGGSVKLGCGQIGTGVTGDTQVGTVILRAKVSSGSGSVSFASGSNIANNGNNVTGGLSGATYTFAAVPVAAPKDTTPPKISNVAVSDIGYHAATVTWTTDEAATSVVEFGLTDGLGLTAQTDGTGTDHKVLLPANQLVPGAKYRYRVKSVDAAGNAATSDLADLVIPGITVKVKVLNAKQKPLLGANVTFIIENVSSKTDKDGLATFTNQAPGKRSVSVSLNNVTVAQAIDITDNVDPAAFTKANLGTQTFTVTLPTKSSVNWLLMISLGVGGLLVGAALAFGGYKLFLFLLAKRRKRHQEKALMVVSKNEHKNEPATPTIASQEEVPIEAPDEFSDMPAVPPPGGPTEEPEESQELLSEPESESEVDTVADSVTDLGPQPAVAMSAQVPPAPPQPQRRFLDVTRPTPMARAVAPPVPARVASAAVPPPVRPAALVTPIIVSGASSEPYILKETPPPAVPMPTAPTTTPAATTPPTTAPTAPETAPAAPQPVVEAPPVEPSPPVNPLPTMAKPPAEPVAPPAPTPATPVTTTNAAPEPQAASAKDVKVPKEGFTIAPAPHVIHPNHYRTRDE